MTERTAVARFGLYLRCVLQVGYFVVGLLSVFLGIWATGWLFQHHREILATSTLAVWLSVLGGTIYYLVDRHDHPNKYR